MNFSWNKWYLLLMLPALLLGFYPMYRLMFMKGDPTRDLIISEVQQRNGERGLEIVGLITNEGNKSYSNVTIEAEFFDKSGAFLDEESEYLHTDIGPGAKEHFKIRLLTADESLQSEDTKMVVKIAGGMSPPF